MKEWTDNLQGLDSLPDDVLALVLDLRRMGAGLVADHLYNDLFIDRVEGLDNAVAARLYTHCADIVKLMASQPGVRLMTFPAMTDSDEIKVQFGKWLMVREMMKEKCRRGEWLHINPNPTED